MLKIRNCSPPNLAGFHPIPAFWVQPKIVPLGWVRRKSSEKGRLPEGPAAVVRSVNISGSPDSNMDGAFIVVDKVVTSYSSCKKKNGVTS